MHEEIYPVKITFELDGSGVAFDYSEPVHLDSLLAWVLRPYKVGKHAGAMNRQDEIDEMSLPLASTTINGVSIWKASAVLPESVSPETLVYWRKKFRLNRVELTSGSPNIQNATYREYNQPLPLILTRRMIAYACVFDRKYIRHQLKRVKYIGKKAAQGHGKVIDVQAERVDYDWSVVKDGIAMRYYPSPDGWKMVRPKPPYWSRYQVVKSLVPGDEIK